MPELSVSSKAEWPQWKWPESGWWFTVAGAVIGVLVLAKPSLISHKLWIRLSVAVLCFVLPVLFHASTYLIYVAFVAFKRLRHYDNIYSDLEQRTEEMIQAQEMILYLLQELTKSRIFAIEKVLYYNQNLYIMVRKKKGVKLESGDKVAVVDLREGTAMGEFEITEIRKSEYMAKSTGYVNALWLGFIHQAGAGESSAPPDTAVIYIATKEGGNS